MKRWQTWTWLSILTLALAGLWSYSVARHAFDDDEFQHTHIAWLMHHGQRPYVDFFEHHLVLYHRLMAPWFHLGEASWQLFVFRGVSLAAAAGTLLLLYQTGRRLGASPAAAGAGVWLLGLTPMFLLKMTEARPEPLAMLAFAAAIRMMVGKEVRSAECGTRNADEETRSAERGTRKEDEETRSAERGTRKEDEETRSAECGTRKEDEEARSAERGTRKEDGEARSAERGTRNADRKYLLPNSELRIPNLSGNFPLWRFVAIGLLAGAMALLSQKYVMVAGGLLLANFVLHGWRPSLVIAAAFLAAMAAYAGWMLELGVARDAFESVVLLNLRWRYSFSPKGYLAELYLTGGGLMVAGGGGILRALAQPGRRRTAWALAMLLAGSALMIALVPVPYRQSFLPLLAVLALGAMGFCAALFRLAAAHHRAWLGPAAAILLGGTSLAALPQHLAADNRADLARMAAVANFAPSGPVFDGRGLMVCRPHVGHHACMHHEVLLMVDLESYAEDAVRALRDAGLPPVIRDYRVAKLPEKIRLFVAENYLETAIPDVLVAGLRRDRLMPGRETAVTIPVAARWRATWRGGEASLDGTSLTNGASMFLDAGDHRLKATGLVWDFRLERDYQGKTDEPETP